LRLAKYVCVGVLGVLALTLVALFAIHRDDAIESETLIDGSPQHVWRVLTATDDYPRWNPEITQLRGELREGNVIEIVVGSGRDAMVFNPTILTVHQIQELKWKGHVWVPGIFDGEHRFVLEAAGGKTRFVQSEAFTGLLAGRLTQGVLSSTLTSMRAMNNALKQRVEHTPE
jgi:hypothetical protein